MQYKRIIRLIALMLSVMMLPLSILSCNSEKTPDETSDAASEETVAEVETTVEETTETETETGTETETVIDTETETAAETEAETVAETTAAETEPFDNGPDNQNPLTGLESEKTYGNSRPVAIMINNLPRAIPQIGVSKADIMYECIVEGGITRLMMVVQDYALLDVVGSIRSCRDYYLDLVANHDALYVHAGGSEEGYNQIQKLGIDNMDGVNQYIPNMFYRDNTRLKTMGMEHSLMTTGAGIVAGIAYRQLRTTLKDNFNPTFDFCEWGTTVTLQNKAKHVHIYFSYAQITDFVYDTATQKYLRYQFNGKPHVDGATGEQLSYTNVLVLFTDCSVIAGDSYGHYTVKTTGTGGGYYITGGKAKVITWSRETRTSPMVLKYMNGDPLLLNRGNTFVSIAPSTGKKYFSLNYEW